MSAYNSICATSNIDHATLSMNPYTVRKRRRFKRRAVPKNVPCRDQSHVERRCESGLAPGSAKTLRFSRIQRRILKFCERKKNDVATLQLLVEKDQCLRSSPHIIGVLKLAVGRVYSNKIKDLLKISTMSLRGQEDTNDLFLLMHFILCPLLGLKNVPASHRQLWRTPCSPFNVVTYGPTQVLHRFGIVSIWFQSDAAIRARGNKLSSS